MNNELKKPRTIEQFLRTTWTKIHQTRRYHLIPYWILLVVVALVLILSGHSNLLPAIYVAF